MDPVALDQDRGLFVSIYHRITFLNIEAALEERVAPQPPKMVSYTASGSSSTRPRQRSVCVYLSGITVLKIEAVLEERMAPQPPTMVSYTASGSSCTRPRQRYVCVYLS